jgi:hypothetical protein
MSGYAQNLLGPQRAIGDGVALIPKPFSEISLLRKVHETIAAGAPTASGTDTAVTR